MKLTEALNRMREMEHTDQTFGIVFLTQTPPTRVRKIERCRLRAVPTNHRNADAFIYFTDLERSLARQCRKRLVTQVCFSDKWERVEI